MSHSNHCVSNVALPCQPKSLGGELLTIKQVADYLKVTERTIYRLAQRWGMGLMVGLTQGEEPWNELVLP